MKYHALFVKFEIVVCCKLKVSEYGFKNILSDCKIDGEEIKH